jgi:predicted ATP-dependent endonuclease of OLD family
LDLWFSIDPEIEFGRVFTLIPNVSADLDHVGIRLAYSVMDAAKLKQEYLSVFPRSESQKPLSHFFSFQENLSRNFELVFSALEEKDNVTTASRIDSKEGRRVLASLLRIDFVDAQRNIDDQELARSNRLSAAFESFYRNNLEQAAISDEANRIIDENNEKLTQHYAAHFQDLMTLIQGLGVPSINDRQMMIISSLSPEEALRGTTSLYYVDPTLGHRLPESYNGLGFKNLIYMAIQISHFQLQWIRTQDKRPLCQLIFIEEPEVHLHAQVQQTFIANIWEIVRQTSENNKEPKMVPQLVITTHSSHILDTVE